jgi:hypothetical protein
VLGAKDRSGFELLALNLKFQRSGSSVIARVLVLMENVTGRHHRLIFKEWFQSYFRKSRTI